ncbi:hypothetical protein [Aliidiomarina haloalkalitolerans]|uniref:Uncharacterized protein n=1 Tax=Aliidiomarina haloalkalitolerans TaxID=859059 RepID=A0A432VTF8_9GAMM|nr:hypothetical protein [Aliidiomarina haloalkalitolerans]RUO19758.1 hypothetical protein CWE06_06880 [Aliidiomarina haloalkalitolerans]
MRTFLIAVAIVLGLVWFGPALITLLVEGILLFFVPLLVVAAVAGVGFFIGSVVFGSTVLAFSIAALVVVVLGFSIFWPVLLLLLIVWLFSRSRTQTL